VEQDLILENIKHICFKRY